MCSINISQSFLNTVKRIKLTTESGSIYELSRDKLDSNTIKVSKNGSVLNNIDCYEIHPGCFVNDTPVNSPISDRIALCCSDGDIIDYTILTSSIRKFELIEDFKIKPFIIESIV